MATLASTLPTPSLTMARSLPQGVEELSRMGPFELFKSQLDYGSTEAKVDAMKRLAVVGYALGADKAQTMLVPFLANNIAMKQPPHEDELLLLLAQQLQGLVPGLFHTSAQCLSLLPILERLMAVEETVVRDQAVICTNHVLPEIQADSEIINLVKRLVGADWFTPKVSAAGVLPQVLNVTKDADLRFLYRDLCQDEAPMVRRSAALHLGKFLTNLPFEKVPDLVLVMQQLCQDEQDSVRLLAVASLKDAHFEKYPEWTAKVILPLVKGGSTDPSWRVRHNLAKCFSQVAANLGVNQEDFATAQSLVMACFVALLQDLEPEVRAAAVGHFAPMVHWGGQAMFEMHLQPLLPALADDVVMEVRSKCALALMDASEGGTLTDEAIVQSFTPLLENFLQDEYAEVQLHVLQNLSRISHLLPQMAGVVTTILNMSKAGNWRVRQGVAQLLPHLAEARGMDFFVSVLLEPAWLALLLDPVAAVRTACVDGMAQLCRVAGPDWVLQHLFPQHVRIYDHASSSYLLRMTILQLHSHTATAAPSADLLTAAVQELLKGLTDKVANVRMAAAKGLADVCKGECDETLVEGLIRPALEKCVADEEDVDSRHYCQLALEIC